jgi:hypothetical protein
MSPFTACIHSNLMPDAFTAAAHFAISLRRFSPNTSGVLPSGS